MAGATVAAYAIMIKDSSGKGARRMAYATIIAGWHMGKGLANRVCAIMTGFTQLVYNTGDSVIESFSPGEGTGIVAHATIGIGGWVVRRLSKRVCAVVTTCTGYRDATMIEDDCLKVIDNMT